MKLIMINILIMMPVVLAGRYFKDVLAVLLMVESLNVKHVIQVMDMSFLELFAVIQRYSSPT